MPRIIAAFHPKGGPSGFSTSQQNSDSACANRQYFFFHPFVID